MRRDWGYALRGLSPVDTNGYVPRSTRCSSLCGFDVDGFVNHQGHVQQSALPRGLRAHGGTQEPSSCCRVPLVVVCPRPEKPNFKRGGITKEGRFSRQKGRPGIGSGPPARWLGLPARWLCRAARWPGCWAALLLQSRLPASWLCNLARWPVWPSARSLRRLARWPDGLPFRYPARWP